MIELPNTTDTPLIRTEFSDDAAWHELIRAVGTPTVDGFLSNVEIVEAPGLASVDVGELTRIYAGGHAIMIVADSRAMSDPSHPLLCVDLETGASLRVIPSALWSIENNLSLGNMDFDDFVESAGEDGIFQGFD